MCPRYPARISFARSCGSRGRPCGRRPGGCWYWSGPTETEEAGCWRRPRTPRRSSGGSRRWISARRSWCAACGCPARVPSADAPGKRLQEVKAYQTMTRSLLVLADRLGELGVTRVVMEATSDDCDDWKPV